MSRDMHPDVKSARDSLLMGVVIGADRERRRIRRAQRDALAVICRLFDQTENRPLHDVLLRVHGQLDAATRAKKGKRK